MTKDFNEWHKQRAKDVAGPLGDLSLIAMHDLRGETTVKELGGIWAPIHEHSPGLRLTATLADGLFLNGEVIEGVVEVIADETVITTATGLQVMATSQPGSNHLLAIWDENCAAVKNFDHLEVYPYNESAVIYGKLVESEQLVSFTHTSDADHAARTHESIGTIEIDLEGTHYSLRPFQSGPYSIIIFRDATSGQETYGMGRMVIVEWLENDRVKLDFNKAFLPPCAFSPYFNCPMPPLSNRIQTKIEAGEKQIITK